jgi:glycosyltransferase involved in cell wall biosynthesis
MEKIEYLKNLETYRKENNVPEDFPSFKDTGNSKADLDRYYRECRLVVAPLRYGAGIKGKIVDALYKNMPVVTTIIGAEGLDGADSCMLIANNENEFAQKTIEIYRDERMADRLAKNALEYCKKNFSQKAAIERLSSLFREFEKSDI